MEVTEVFSQELIIDIKKEINEVNGKEIFLVGKRSNDEKIISHYELRARGNYQMAPAIVSNLHAGDLLIHNHPSQDLTPSAPDIRIASALGEKGIGFAIINNSVTDIYIVVEPSYGQAEINLDKNEIISYFEENGILSKYLNKYEYRQQQIKVVEEIIDSFNNHKINLIEAGTGTGKSLAYLIPALYFANLNNLPVVVSTNTINLQEQLINKDLILLKKVLPFSFKSLLIKGRSNYVCLRKLNYFQGIARESIEDDVKKDELSKILNWIETSKTGTKSDLNFKLETDIWEEISSESDLCLKNRCPYFERCYFMKARKEIYSSDLLIVNHHFLLSDARLKNEGSGILPDYRYLIIDEAHNLSGIASRHLGLAYTQKSVNKYLLRLNDKKYSLIPRLRNMISNLNFDKKKEILNIIDQKILPGIVNIKELNTSYFNQINNYLKKKDDSTYRIKKDIIEEEDWKFINITGEKILVYLKKLILSLNKIYKNIYEKTDTNLVLELDSNINRLEIFIEELDFNLYLKDENFVYWLEKSKQKNAPLDVSELLNEYIWDKINTGILTSATLTVNKSFDYNKSRLGLKNSSDVLVSSPFDYSKQVDIYIPVDILPPNNKNFLNSIIDDLGDLLIKYDGSTMVLFTSYYMLNYCLNKLENKLNQHGINVLAQGRYSRYYIVDKFKQGSSQIIFGTSSFWEGVDFKGNVLRNLIMMKLPFPVPSDPLAAARSEMLEKEGKNSFYNYSLPQAVIRFKQGFGRLIRSKSDQGKFIIFDNRILKKSYGKIFLNSLPSGCQAQKVEMKDLL